MDDRFLLLVRIDAMSQGFDRTLNAWAEPWIDANLRERVRPRLELLVAQQRQDLKRLRVDVDTGQAARPMLEHIP